MYHRLKLVIFFSQCTAIMVSQRSFQFPKTDFQGLKSARLLSSGTDDVMAADRYNLYCACALTRRDVEYLLYHGRHRCGDLAFTQYILITYCNYGEIQFLDRIDAVQTIIRITFITITLIKYENIHFNRTT